MRHEKIIKRENGDKLRIAIVFYASFSTGYKYSADVWFTAKGKRKEIINKDIATPEEIHTAKLELWEQLKPVK